MMRLTAVTPQALAREHPEWAAWLALLDEARRAQDEPLWTRGLPAVDTLSAGAAPLLHHVVLAVDARRAERFVRRLLDLSAPGGAVRSSRLDLPRLLEAAVRQDLARLDEVAGELGMAPVALRAVAAVAVMPLLHACRRAWTDAWPKDWREGICPLCGAWPALAEARGLERCRRLRCARCGGDWDTDWLRCPYCQNREHERLGSLVTGAALDTLKLETCEACHGYIKTLTTLQATPPEGVALLDLATVELDLAGLEHGYRRPHAPGHALEVQVLAA
jgi:FdhE protein